jgi:FAD:protein FMN transferase
MLAFDAIGTHWEIETDEPITATLRRSILDRIERFDATYSRFRPDSLVAQIAAAPDGGRFEFPPEAGVLFALYDQLGAATDGAVDPLVGRQLELLGYDTRYSLIPAAAAVRSAEHERRPTWAADVHREGTTLVTRRPVSIDVGAAGKGLLVDLVAQMLIEGGIPRFVVDAGGDLRHYGDRPIRVGLEHPLDPTSVVGIVDLRNGALCASAVNRRAWGDGLHHVLDARTGAPTDGVLATWVLAEEAVLADGVATALFFTDRVRLHGMGRFEWVRMFADRIESCAGFRGELFG